MATVAVSNAATRTASADWRAGGIHFYRGDWLEGKPLLLSPSSLGVWLGSTVFDGARAFDGVTPDLLKHCQRVINSARTLGMSCAHSAEEIEALAHEGLRRMDADGSSAQGVYIKPVIWANEGFISPDPASSEFCLSLTPNPITRVQKGLAITLSPFRRPSIEFAPTDAKAACLYPNSARALREANARGYDNCVMLDPNGNVSELATANIWLVKDGVALTPVPNGTFLSGITRARTIELLRAAGVTVVEKTITWQELLDADELFISGNAKKITPIIRIGGPAAEDRDLQPGPITQRLRDLYWDWAASQGRYNPRP